MIVVSIGCPAGVGPEVAVKAAARLRGTARVLVGDRATILEAARACRVSERRFVDYAGAAGDRGRIQIAHAGPELSKADRRPGRPSRRAGAAQLAYIERAYELARQSADRALVTGPVSKAAIARSAAPGAKRFRGHTEWLARLDGARMAVMCFWSDRLATSLVTTHLPLSRVSRALSVDRVSEACVKLAALLRATGAEAPSIAVASLNPHAGEDQLFGREETEIIEPGMRRAKRRVGRGCRFVGPIGAETAYRLAAAGQHAGVVAMYHDQATIPMKLLSFGTAVNVTMGLRVVRTSVDHGTGYDIAWQGRAEETGMLQAMRLAERLVAKPSRDP